ncbi:hypothetical protein [Emcibacter nanhaiensis]|uniref:GNAT family N-acetyltransferase n=1 Tax=Emcibacter nanhaiensis TaxID=1505037 RepID=A0A501P965_9PROT|nr:hypothetical protein [Emcibacter nanhaiensis]TPD56853.1 hypothetical protein FIV46_17950 [Emcibacter nanhaiensis]
MIGKIRTLNNKAFGLVMSLFVKSFADDPTLASRISELEDESFPQFLNEEPTWQQTQDAILKNFAHYHYFILNDENKTVGININVPLCWDGSPEDLPGYNELLLRCLEEYEDGAKPTALVGIFGAVAPDSQGQGITKLFLRQNSKLTRDHSMTNYLSPVRPAIKQFYPTFTFDEFLCWRDKNGGLIDPWLNSFVKLGAKNLGIAYDSITVTASLKKWTEWTGLEFPVSGDYVIPGGHRPLAVDAVEDTGRYGEDHLWFDIPLFD